MSRDVMVQLLQLCIYNLPFSLMLQRGQGAGKVFISIAVSESRAQDFHSCCSRNTSCLLLFLTIRGKLHPLTPFSFTCYRGFTSSHETGSDFTWCAWNANMKGVHPLAGVEPGLLFELGFSFENNLQTKASKDKKKTLGP